MQTRVTKLIIPSVGDNSYEDRLRDVNLFSWQTRILRGQLIEVYLCGFKNIDYSLMFQLSGGVN